jgi:hypothetical protein
MRARLASLILAVAVVLGAAACGAKDNGGVIEGPLDTSPNATQGP